MAGGFRRSARLLALVLVPPAAAWLYFFHFDNEKVGREKNPPANSALISDAAPFISLASGEPGWNEPGSGIGDPGGHSPYRGSEIRIEALALADSGKVAEAISLMSRALEQDPYNDLFSRDMSHLLARRGWESFSEDDHVKAKGFFMESLFHWPDNEEALRGMAYSTYKEGKKDEAENWLDLYVEEGGSRPEAFDLMGRICYENNRLDEAVEYFRLSLSLEPEQEGAAKMLEKAKREARVERDFLQSRTRHFIIKREGSGELGNHRVIGLMLEDAYLEVGKDLGFFPDGPVTVILYADEKFVDVTRSPAWAGAVFDGKIRIPAKGLKRKTRDLERLISHEYTHALVHEVARGKAPVWFHEGMAQRSEGQVEDPGALAARLVKLGRPAPLRKLEGSFMALGERGAQAAYVESLLAVQYIETRYGPFSLREIMSAMEKGMDFGEAVKRVTKRKYADVDLDFRDWITGMADDFREGAPEN